MQSIEPVATFVLPNEKAYLLVEINLPHPVDYKGKFRYQMIWVNRDDQITRYIVELGSAEDFTAPQLRIPSFWEHSVAELQYLADEERWINDYWVKRSAEVAAGSTLIKDFQEQLEESYKIARNQSTFGPNLIKQRNRSVPLIRRG